MERRRSNQYPFTLPYSFLLPYLSQCDMSLLRREYTNVFLVDAVLVPLRTTSEGGDEVRVDRPEERSKINFTFAPIFFKVMALRHLTIYFPASLVPLIFCPGKADDSPLSDRTIIR